MRDSSLTAVMLSRWLLQSGTLTRGTVVDLRVELEIETTVSRLKFVTVTYSSDAPADFPHRLVVKSPLANPNANSVNSTEMQFYRQLAPILGTPPIVRCLATIDDSNDEGCAIVLEDLRITHDHPPWPIPPCRRHCELALDALARVHSQWWESPMLGQSIGQSHSHESLTNMVQGIAAQLPAFIDSYGKVLTVEPRRVLERVFDSALRPWMRLTDPRALTVIHGDAHTWNFLFPRAGEDGAFLIDWQLWHVDVGARDLAFLMALHWYPSRRREFELPFLRYYHEKLIAQGVESYSFDELWLDYRRCVVRNLTIPILFWSRGMKPEGWWHRLECALAAYRDLDCEELL